MSHTIVGPLRGDQPILRISTIDPTFVLECAVDTGFEGSFMLPWSLINPLMQRGVVSSRDPYLATSTVGAAGWREEGVARLNVILEPGTAPLYEMADIFDPGPERGGAGIAVIGCALLSYGQLEVDWKAPNGSNDAVKWHL